MSASSLRSSAAAASAAVTALLLITTVVSVPFLIIGLALPVLLLPVHQRSDHGTLVVGLITSSQCAAALISRLWRNAMPTVAAASAITDSLLTVAGAGLLYLVSITLTTCC